MSYDVLITTPLFYASGDPHIGHAYSLIIGDLIKKYYALIGKKAFLLVGVDEHGEKIQEKAKEFNLSPREFVDNNSKKFRELWNFLEITPDIFLRTSDEKHKEFVSNLFEFLVNSQQIYLSNWTGYNCTICETNYSEKYYSQKKFCELGHELKRKTEDTYFLKIKDHARWLDNHFSNNPIISPNHYLKSLKINFLNSLEDLSITRKNLDWGIKILNSEFSIYVWFEALTCYFSNLSIKHLWEKNNKTKIVQIIGKEIFRFHAIYLPIMLKSLELKLPSKLIVHGWLLNNNRKISKSESKTNPFSPLPEILKNFSLESIKWYFVFLNWNDDHSFSEELVKQFFNKYIVNLLGNLINRLKGVISKNNYSTSFLDNHQLKNDSLHSEFQRGTQLLKKLSDLIENIQIPELIQEVIKILETANALIEQLKPWTLSVDSNDYKELNVFLYRQLVLSANLLSPIFNSNKWEEIKNSLSICNQQKESLNIEFLNSLSNFAGIKLPSPSNLFTKYS